MDEVDFLPEDKRQMFPQIDTIISGVCVCVYVCVCVCVFVCVCDQACLNYPKQQVCYFFAIS